MTTQKRTSPKPFTPVKGAAIGRSGEDRGADRQDLSRAEIRQRQRSMVNAMLCCLI